MLPRAHKSRSETNVHLKPARECAELDQVFRNIVLKYYIWSYWSWASMSKFQFIVLFYLNSHKQLEIVEIEECCFLYEYAFTNEMLISTINVTNYLLLNDTFCKIQLQNGVYNSLVDTAKIFLWNGISEASDFSGHEIPLQ